jgi:hypothetical protein
LSDIMQHAHYTLKLLRREVSIFEAKVEPL